MNTEIEITSDSECDVSSESSDKFQKWNSIQYCMCLNSWLDYFDN